MGLRDYTDILTKMDMEAYAMFKDYYDAELPQNMTKNILSAQVTKTLALLACLINLRRMGIFIDDNFRIEVARRLRYTSVKNIPPFYIGYFPFTQELDGLGVYVNMSLNGIWQTKQFKKEFNFYGGVLEPPAMHIIL